MAEVAVGVGSKVACHAVVRGGVDAVGGQVDLHHPVALKVVEFSCGGAGRRGAFFGNHDDAVVALADSDFILGAYHA